MGMPKTWLLEEAVEFVRYVQGWVEPYGFHVGITGSVLIKGRSDNDLDIIIYPASTRAQDSSEKFGSPPREYIQQVLRKAGLKQMCDRDFVTKMWREAGSDDEKHVEVWRCTAGIPSYADRRVDIFFLS